MLIDAGDVRLLADTQAGAQRRGLIDSRRHHLGADSVTHLGTALCVPVLNGGDAEPNGLVWLIAPIGPVGRQANLNSADAILGDERKGNKRE